MGFMTISFARSASIDSYRGQAHRPSAIRRSTDAQTGTAWHNVRSSGERGPP